MGGPGSGCDLDRQALLWTPAVETCSPALLCLYTPLPAPRRFPPSHLQPALGDSAEGSGGGVSPSAPYMLGCQITLAVSWDLEQCVNWWHWERKFILGAAMKCSENCFHVLMSGEASQPPAQALLCEPRMVTAHVVLTDTFGF